jgi:hypothetical protein
VQVESELATLDDSMKDEFLETLGVSKEKCGLNVSSCSSNGCV